MAPRITVLCGGLGGARLALALQEAGLEGSSAFVTNVADDIVWDGALVCPDTDAVLYSLSGVFDHERGWGVKGDDLPPPNGAWFSVGARDREHHRHRQALLGCAPLSEATAIMAEELLIMSTLVPATDAPVRTMVHAGGRWTGFQEWLVRDHAPPAAAVRYDGINDAVAAPGVLDLLADSDVVVLASSSPVASIEPILALPGVRDVLQARRGPTAAVSPVLLRRPPVTARDERRATARQHLLAAVGAAHTPVAVAARYAPLVDTFVLDPADAGDASAVVELGLCPEVAPVTGESAEDRAALVDCLLQLATVPIP